MSLTFEQLDDFIATTLAKQPRDTWVDLSMDLQRYTWVSRWFKSKKKPERGGPQLEWKLRIANQGTATHAGLYHVDKTNRKDVLTNGEAKWSKQTVNYIYDVDETAFQSGPETIIREIMLLEQGLTNDFVKLMEMAMWTAPSASDLKPMPPSGIPFWVQKNATFGFNGGDPSGWAAGAGGILTTSYPGWKNHSGTYAAVTPDDCVEKLVESMDMCDFEAPAQFPEIGKGPPDWGLFTVYSVLKKLRRLTTAQNDNLGGDVAKWMNSVVVRGIPVVWVPALSNTTSEAYDYQCPIYGINWKVFEYFFKTGRSMVKYPPKTAPHQNSVRIRIMDNWGNFVCYDRRRNFVLYDSTVSAA